MRILITGNGMLATALVHAARERGEMATALPRAVLDITHRDEVLLAFSQLKPALVFHAAALTRVNYCEEHPDEAMLINRDGTINVIAACAQLRARLVFFSTDYVFPGTKNEPWVETDATDPVNAYGYSKLAAEEHVRDYQFGHVVRTSGVFGSNQARDERNFFRAIYNQLIAGGNPRVVNDQFTTVTFATHLAQMLLSLLPDLPPLVHLTSAGADSWHGWASRFARALGLDPLRIEAVSTDDGEPVQRPRYSVLGTSYPQLASIVNSYSAEAGIEAYSRQLQA